LIETRFSVPLLALAAALVAFAVAEPVVAATRPGPGPTPAPSPAATAAPTAEPLDKMIPRLEAAVKADPNDKTSASQLAAAYLQAGRPDLTLGITQKLIAGGSKTAQLYYIDGAANVSVGKIKEATASLEQASNLEPTNIAILQMLTQVYMQANRPDDAERVAKRALTFNKDSKDAFENYGFVLATLKRYDDARQQFESAAKIDPKDPHPVVLEARAYQEQNAVALANQLYDRALGIDSKNLEALVGKAQLAAASHNVKDATTTYETILALQKDDFDRAAVVDEIAKVYAVEKMDDQADVAYRRAIDTYPSIPSTHVAYGDYLASKNDRAGAEREWNLGLGANRDNPTALMRLGDLAMESKNYPKAVDTYKRLTEVASKDPAPFLFLGQAYMATQKFEDAKTQFKQSYGLQHTPDALVGLADADVATKNFTEAVQIYEALDKNAPDLVKKNPGLLYGMGRAYQGANQSQKAREAYARLLAVLQPGTQNYNEVKSLIDGIDRAGRSGGSATPRPAAAATPKPKHKP
jgi:tetratricopeptide (TPR) repeat protein